MPNKINDADLMLNADGSVYHLNLLPEDIAPTVILVGDPQRVDKVSQYFDRVETIKHNREFLTHTGYVGQKRLSVLSTGIGASNIDIALNELDAAVNVDLTTRTLKPDFTQLTFIRLGTCGGLQADIPVESFVVSSAAFAFDGILNYYQLHNDTNNQALLAAVQQHFQHVPMHTGAYVGSATRELVELFAPHGETGITFTCPGFYGAQGRNVRLPLAPFDLLDTAQHFEFQQQRTLNFEMETAAIYGLSNLLGHRCCSLSTILANRAQQVVTDDFGKAVKSLLTMAMDVIC